MTLIEVKEPSTKRWTPLKHQVSAVKWLLQNQFAALCAEPGAGKTSATLAALKILLGKGYSKCVVIVAPKTVMLEVWPDELQKWEDFKGIAYVVAHGPKRMDRLREHADVYIMTPEGFTDLLSKGLIGTPSTNKWRLPIDTLVIDELSKYKHRDTVRVKTMVKHGKGIPRKWGLTGTPRGNSLLDLFPQCLVIDNGHTFGPYITHYRREYFVPDYTGYNWTIKPGAEEKILARFATLAKVVRNDELDLPETVYNDVRVTLPPKAWKTYKELHKQLVTEIEGKTVIAGNSLVAQGKCVQMANGALFTENDTHKKDRTYSVIHNEKLDALCNLVDELQGAPLLVAYHFQHDLQRIRQRLGADVPVIGGETTRAQLKDIRQRWNRGEIPVLLGHPKSMGYGLNLQEAANQIAWFALTWSYQDFYQYNCRLIRQGNKAQHVIVHRFITRGTTDEAMISALKENTNCHAVFMQRVRELNPD